ncbi:hypothetical protein KDX24_16375, partial [Pseudomonas sp. CDFA 550]|nr:hypothetical protein [Pseudomonas quasicaspiana]
PYRVIVHREQARLPQNLRNSRVGRADIGACAKSSVRNIALVSILWEQSLLAILATGFHSRTASSFIASKLGSHRISATPGSAGRTSGHALNILRQKYRAHVYFVGAELARDIGDGVSKPYRVIVLRGQASLQQDLRQSYSSSHWQAQKSQDSVLAFLHHHSPITDR